MGILAAIDIMMIFDVILVVFGIHTVYSAIKMKNTKEPGGWLVGDQKLQSKKAEAFVEAIYGKTVIFGIFVTVYGVINLLNRLVLHIPLIDIISSPVFIILCVYYVITLNKTRDKYL